MSSDGHQHKKEENNVDTEGRFKKNINSNKDSRFVKEPGLLSGTKEDLTNGRWMFVDLL